MILNGITTGSSIYYRDQILITISCLFFLAYLPGICHNDSGNKRTIEIVADASQPGEKLRHVWQFFGYDECNYTTTLAGKKLLSDLSRIHREPVYIRCHFLLNSGDGMPELKWGSTNVYTEDSLGQPIYNWEILDGIMDAIVGSGCRPFVEIGLMPKALSTKPEPYKHEWPKSNLLGCSYPPKDYNKWAELIQKWVLHSKERYGEKINDWIWQLWNEPNISYWKGSFEEFCKLYDYTESAIHQVAPEIVFGGPHVANSGKRRYSDGFLRDFLTHCLKGTHAYTKKKGTQLDYIAFHSKGRVDLFENKPRLDLGRHLHHTQLQFDVISEFPELKKLPIIIGESDPEGAAALSARINPANAYRNGSAYAAYVAAMMKHIIDMARSKQLHLKGVVTWAFMFDGKDYFEGFRTLSTNGIYKPVFNIFRLLNMLSGQRIPVHSSGALGTDQVIKNKVRQIPDIDGLAVTTDQVTQVLLWNYHDHVIPLSSALIQLKIKVPIINHRRARLTHYRIDDQHSNSYTKWLELGSPQQLTSDLLDILYQAAELDLLEPVSIHQVFEGELQIEFDLPHHAVSLIELFWL